MDARTDQLVGILLPVVRQLCSQAPDYGEISISATLHDGEIVRINQGVSIGRRINPEEHKGGRRLDQKG